MTSSVPPPLQVFISYSHKDEELREELDVHLANLKRQGKIGAWHDRAIEAGAEWDAEIKRQLETAEIILLLITPRFVASDYCYDLEMQRAVQRHDEGSARVIPIIVKPCDWQDSPFSKLQVLPKDAKPVTKWDDRDEAFLNVVQGIRRAVETLQAKKSEGVTLEKEAIAPTPPLLTPAIGTGERALGTSERALGRGERPFAPTFSTYKAETWTGRAEIVADLTDALVAGCRLLIIHGMTGIGKTALAEKLAADLMVNGADGTSDRLFLPPEIKFHRISFDIGTPSTDFTRGAIAILQAIGDDTAQQLPDEQILPYLLKALEQRPYWLQLDSLEYLLRQSSDGSYQFADAVWVEFFGQLLNSPRSQSRLVLTSQALPTDLVDRIYRYDQLWHEYSLRGLEADHWLDLLRNYGITPSTDTECDYVCAIAHYFQGHPLILKMIAGDIRSRLFGGSITKYWMEYYNCQPHNPRQPSSTLRQSQEQRARQWVSQTIQQLPDLPRQMLQRSAVFRRPVAESFYLQMLEDVSDSDRTAALTTLKSRNLVEDIDIQAGQLLIQQHNLIRDSAYAQLKATPSTWETAEHNAAHLWLTAYTSPSNAERIETVRGYLEAFAHYCEVEDWETACRILDIQIDSPTQEPLHWQLETWGYYREEIELYQQVIHKTSRERDILWLRGLGLVSRTLGAPVQAIQYHQQSLELAREMGDCQGQWKALNNLSGVYQILGDYRQSIEYLEQTLALAQDIGDRRGKGNALGNLGIAYCFLGQYEQAIAHHQQNLTIAKEIGDRRGEGNALGNLGIAYDALGQYEQAIAHHQQNLAIAQDIGDRQGEGKALGNLGSTYKSLGQYEQAITHHQRSLTIAKEIGDKQSEGIALGSVGIAYYSLGQYEQAIAHHQQNLTIAREIGDRRSEGIALNNLGIAYNALGQYEQAIAHHQQNLTIVREIGDRRNEGIALNNLGVAYDALGQCEQAIIYYQQRLSIAREIGDRRGEGIALVNWGATQIELEQCPEAMENSLAALAILREIGDRASEAEVLRNLAELHQKLGEADVAREYCEQASALATELGIPLVEECQKLWEELGFL
ncbi:tetratricopeptide repeat protein [Oculatella sp. FACHB-28]|uniref:tetratricopeptide repeat protein n=1 Tax=Oculatella sp. FACHB-28 TaxID=2692845 RepID=UPI001682AC45|nr:tetratricopeptide repeat protein [Oculatella sp. FACHB-28]MBD2059038.1 tetratricopeptide repeat protein [Oculatella sp. FACHB-28]